MSNSTIKVSVIIILMVVVGIILLYAIIIDFQLFREAKNICKENNFTNIRHYETDLINKELTYLECWKMKHKNIIINLEETQ